MIIVLPLVLAVAAADIAWRMHLKAQVRTEQARIDAALQPLSAQLQTLSSQLQLNDLSFFLRPEALTATDQLDAGKVGLGRHRELLAQRAQLFGALLQQERTLLDAPGAGGGPGHPASATASSRAEEDAKMAALSRADAGKLDAIQALFDWAQTRLPQLRQARATQAATELQARTELQALYDRIRQAEHEDAQAADDAKAALLAEKARLDENLQQMTRHADLPLLGQMQHWLSS